MIGLDGAVAIIDNSLKHARASGLKPMTVVVLDASGCLVALKREDGSSLFRPRIAEAKAAGALGMGMGSRALANRAETHPAFINAVIALADGMLVPVPGGVLIRSTTGNILGAVGVSGDHSDKDEACATAGIEAAALVAETGA